MGNDTQKIVDEAFKILDGKGKRGNCPELWDGRASERIINILSEYLVQIQKVTTCPITVG